MYIMPDMIDLGLKEKEKWQSKAHRTVAQNVCLCNSRVVTRQSLMDMVGKINKIPKDQIKKVTANDLAYKFKVPFISLS